MRWFAFAGLVLALSGCDTRLPFEQESGVAIASIDLRAEQAYPAIEIRSAATPFVRKDLRVKSSRGDDGERIYELFMRNQVVLFGPRVPWEEVGIALLDELGTPGPYAFRDVTGRVRLSFTLDKDGHVSQVMRKQLDGD